MYLYIATTIDRSILRFRSFIKTRGYSSAIAAMGIMLVLSMLPVDAMAQTLNMPFVNNIGCQIANWMKGPLAIMIFVVICIAILIVGLITKMDWARMITIAVVFGIIQGITGILLNSGQIDMSAMACLSN